MFVQDNVLAYFCFYNSVFVHQNASAYCLVEQCFRAPKCLNLFLQHCVRAPEHVSPLFCTSIFSCTRNELFVISRLMERLSLSKLHQPSDTVDYLPRCDIYQQVSRYEELLQLVQNCTESYVFVAALLVFQAISHI